MAGKQRIRRLQKPKERVANARERNVFAVRRTIHPESYPVFEKAAKNLDVEIHGSGRLFVPSMLTVTIAGLSRFTKEHKQFGPSTYEMLDKMEGTDSPIPAKIGGIALFGGGAKYKLGFHLQSPEISDQVEQCEKTFRDNGYPLRTDPNSQHGTVPHCSIALMDYDKETIQHFDDERTQRRLDSVAGVLGKNITLDIVRLPRISQ